MLINHQLLINIIPQMADAVTGASLIFAPMMSVFGFALLFLFAGWMLSSLNSPPAARYSQTYFYQPPATDFYQPVVHQPVVHHHPSYDTIHEHHSAVYEHH